MIQLITNPTTVQIDELKNWLESEYNLGENGFINNWNIIVGGVESKQTILFEQDQKIIGFAHCSYHDRSAEVNIFNIKKEKQNKGNGTFAYQLLESFLMETGNIAIKLFCEPIESESFWIKQGFKKTPETRFAQHYLSYWKSIIDILEPTTVGEQNKIELWNVEPSQIKDFQPVWIWNLTDISKSIIQYVDCDWNIKITINGNVIGENKIKRITNNYDEYLCGSYLYISDEVINKLLASNS